MGAVASLEAYRQGLLGWVCLAFGLMLIAPPSVGLDVDLLSFLTVLPVALVLLAFIPFVRWRGLHGFVPALESCALGIIATVPVVVATYAAMRTGLPLADPTLRAMDEALGFDWIAFAMWVDRSALLSQALARAYESFTPQLLVLPFLLALAGLPERAYQFISAYLVICLMSALVSILFPSEGAYVTHGVGPGDFAHMQSPFGHFFLESFHAVRDPAPYELSFGAAAGIITFPSVHAGVAALCAWAAWPSPVLRVPVAILNVAMAVSAVTHGAHYLVDIIAGLVAAALSVAAVQALALYAQRMLDAGARPKRGAPVQPAKARA